jgi:integrase
MTDLPKAISEYIRLRRALGFQLRGAQRYLRRFAEFMARRKARFITTALAVQWATVPTGCHPGNWARRLSVIRCFARFRQAADPRNEVPPQGLLPQRHRRTPRSIPTDADLASLLTAARRVRSPKGLWATTHATLIGLLAVTGMRVGEAVALDHRDVDFQNGVIAIRHAKFGKSRLVPLHPSTLKPLRAYARLRDKTIPTTTSAAAFFTSERGNRLTAKFVGKKYLVLARQAGFRAARGCTGPRLHDLRHRFAVRTMVAWYRDGVDVERSLPVLATYLGHLNVATTYWYLSATPELLALAVRRAEQSIGEDPS